MTLPLPLLAMAVPGHLLPLAIYYPWPSITPGHVLPLAMAVPGHLSPEADITSSSELMLRL